MLLRGQTGYNTTALIELVQVQGAHGKTARPLRLMGHLKRLYHIFHCYAFIVRHFHQYIIV